MPRLLKRWRRTLKRKRHAKRRWIEADKYHSSESCDSYESNGWRAGVERGSDAEAGGDP